MEGLSWVFTGKAAEEFRRKLEAPKERRPLITGSRHDPVEVKRHVLKMARKRKAEWDAEHKDETYGVMKGKSMKLYIWSGLDSIGQAGPGKAFAHAETKERAIELILEQMAERDDFYKRIKELLKEELETGEPKVFEGEHGQAEWGTA